MNDDDRVEVAPSLTQAQFLRFALMALGMSAMKWAAFLGAFGLFAGAVAYPHWIRLASAATFAVLIYLPLVVKRERRT